MAVVVEWVWDWDSGGLFVSDIKAAFWEASSWYSTRESTEEREEVEPRRSRRVDLDVPDVVLLVC